MQWEWPSPAMKQYSPTPARMALSRHVHCFTSLPCRTMQERSLPLCHCFHLIGGQATYDMASPPLCNALSLVHFCPLFVTAAVREVLHPLFAPGGQLQGCLGGLTPLLWPLAGRVGGHGNKWDKRVACVDKWAALAPGRKTGSKWGGEVAFMHG